jgi:hypothetical protein
MFAEAFERVKGQVGSCGIWCGSCIVGNGTLGELAKRYEHLLRAYGLDHWGPPDFDFDQFVVALESLRGIPLCPGCLMGGGRENCELRACASTRGLDGCNRCAEMDMCEHGEILEHMRSGALEAGLFVNTGEVDSQLLVDRWTADLKTEWPCSILFARD